MRANAARKNTQAELADFINGALIEICGHVPAQCLQLGTFLMPCLRYSADTSRDRSCSDSPKHQHAELCLNLWTQWQPLVTSSPRGRARERERDRGTEGQGERKRLARCVARWSALALRLRLHPRSGNVTSLLSSLRCDIKITTARVHFATAIGSARWQDGGHSMHSCVVCFLLLRKT